MMDGWHIAALTVGVALLSGALGLIIGGSRLVRTYDWDTEWHIDAPLAEVYRVMTTPDEQRHWWPSMMVAQATARSDGQPGGTVTYRVKQAQRVARFVRPFVITSVTEDVEPARRTRSVVTGDLIGVLETIFAARPDGGTRIRYHWYVRVGNPIFNLAGFFAAPLFRASHDHVMDEGEAGLNRYLRERAATTTSVTA